MGCPKSFSVKGGMGAALLDKPEVGTGCPSGCPWLGKSQEKNGGSMGKSSMNGRFHCHVWLPEGFFSMSKITCAAEMIAGPCLTCSVSFSHTFFCTILSLHLSRSTFFIAFSTSIYSNYRSTRFHPMKWVAPSHTAPGRGGDSDVAATCPALWEVGDLQDPHASEHRRRSDPMGIPWEHLQEIHGFPGSPLTGSREKTR